MDRHGFDLAEFEVAFSFDRFLSRPTKPSRTGRARFVLVGLWNDEEVVVAIVSPLGTEALSVVSVRPANIKERAAYDEAYTQEDWDDVSDNPELTDEEIAQLRPAQDVLPPDLFARLVNRGGRPKAEIRKVSVTIRLDPQIVDAFKATGKGWQTRINDVLARGAAQLTTPAKASRD